MSLVDSNIKIISEVLGRYENTGLEEEVIFLTKKGHQGKVGDGKCWGYADVTQVKLLEIAGILTSIKIQPHPREPEFNLYEGIVKISKARDWLDNILLKKKISSSNVGPLEKPLVGLKGKGKALRRMARLFEKYGLDQEKQVPNYLLAKCIHPTIRITGKKRRRFKNKDYVDGKEKFDKEIKNRVRKLRNYWKDIGFGVKFRSKGYCELEHLQ